MKVIPVGTNSKTSESQSIDHAKFVCSRYKTIKMRVDTTKSWFVIDSSDKIASFLRHLYMTIFHSFSPQENFILGWHLFK